MAPATHLQNVDHKPSYQRFVQFDVYLKANEKGNQAAVDALAKTASQQDIHLLQKP